MLQKALQSAFLLEVVLLELHPNGYRLGYNFNGPRPAYFLLGVKFISSDEHLRHFLGGVPRALGRLSVTHHTNSSLWRRVGIRPFQMKSPMSFGESSMELDLTYNKMIR